ncbi:MAG: hypothetical protein NVS4B3_08610 [Gemmatimonadaceae bacterium]
MRRQYGVVHDGVMAGVLGATGVAVWFLAVDLFFGHPLATPLALGRSLFSVLGPPGSEGAATFIVGYTIFHFAAFSLVGILVATVVHFADREPSVLAGLVILFVAFEVAFQGLSMILAHSMSLGNLGWYEVATGNLIAAVVMGVYLWRAHPALRGNLSRALGGGES